MNRSISFATWHVLPESRMKDYLSGYLEFLVISIKAIITRSITLISLLYSYYLGVGLIIGVTNYNFFITSALNYSHLVDLRLSYKLGVLLILSLTIFIMCSRGYQTSRAVARKAY